jgi:uncharacterized membrane protein
MRATLTALTFPTSEGARAVLDDVKLLSTRNLIKLHDAVLLEWPEGARRPKTRQLSDVEGVFAFGGSFAGLLLGALFTVPLLGAAAGVAGGLVLGRSLRALSRVGVDPSFIDSVRAEVVPGTSALFLLTSDAAEGEVVAALRGTDMRLAATNLSDDQAAELRRLLEIEE